ncbi:PIN domain-containing protein [Candidatus Woesearchaeota archaeon]|nr:PIN domain-containing protein [Candidatus Woesearchaeota archaeon]
MTESLYFDTYALVEIAQSKQSYDKYRRGVLIITNKLNIMELAYFLLRIGKEDKVAMIFSDYLRYNVEPSTNALIEAVKLKFMHKKKKLSYIDCIGYAIAKENKVKFLTGDEKFRDMGNVEFVK